MEGIAGSESALALKHGNERMITHLSQIPFAFMTSVVN